MFFFGLFQIASAIVLNVDRKWEEKSALDSFEALVSEQPLAFPNWLADLTGLSQWPGINPPYIALDRIDLDQVPFDSESWIHKQGDCRAELNNFQVCSFDCHSCVAPDDVNTCSTLSQTFDDGPSPHTTTLTDLLQSPSTFFTIGVNVVRFPQIYRETAEKGHLMASHTWSHKFLPELSNEQIVAEIQWSIWAMNATCGHVPKWFRPPYGGIDNRVRSIVRQFGMRSVLWNFDTFDWAIASGQASETEEDLQIRLEHHIGSHGNTGIILEHDSLEKTVQIASRLLDNIGPGQLTVAQCAEAEDYIEVFR